MGQRHALTLAIMAALIAAMIARMGWLDDPAVADVALPAAVFVLLAFITLLAGLAFAGLAAGAIAVASLPLLLVLGVIKLVRTAQRPTQFARGFAAAEASPDFEKD